MKEWLAGHNNEHGCRKSSLKLTIFRVSIHHIRLCRLTPCPHLTWMRFHSSTLKRKWQTSTKNSIYVGSLAAVSDNSCNIRYHFHLLCEAENYVHLQLKFVSRQCAQQPSFTPWRWCVGRMKRFTKNKMQIRVITIADKVLFGRLMNYSLRRFI